MFIANDLGITNFILEKINEEMEIDSIEMDAFDKRIDDEGRSNSSITSLKSILWHYQ